MATMSLNSQIKSIYQSLTKTEKKVADYTLKHIEQLDTMTLSEMSKAINVGEATIMRFVYKLGYESLAQFKVEIIKEMVKKKEDKDDDSAESYAKSIYDLMIDTIQANPKENIEKVVNLIEKAKHIYFLGNGTSGYSAEVAAYRFFRGGVSCESVTDVHMMTMKSALIKKDELMIVISQSGDNSNMIDAVNYAKKNHCPVVMITARKYSSLLKMGDVCLFHAPISLADLSYYGGTLGIIIQEFILELVFKAYSQRNLDIVDEIQRITTLSTDVFHESLYSKSKNK